MCSRGLCEKLVYPQHHGLLKTFPVSLVLGLLCGFTAALREYRLACCSLPSPASSA